MTLSLKSIFSSLNQEAASTSNRVVGIDVGSAAIKVVELEQTEKTILLRTYGELQLGPYTDAPLGQAVTPPIADITTALVDVLRESNVKAKHGVLALPLSSSFVTVISVNQSAGEDLSKVIPVEARKYIPVPMSEVTLDWSELAPIGKANTNTTEVLLAAIQTESLTSYSSLLRGVSMSGSAQEIEVFSSIRALQRPDEKRPPVGIIDLGARVSKLYVVRDGNLERIHRVTAGGSEITKKLAALQSIEFVDAEMLKRDPAATEASEDIRKATQAVLGGPVQEFKRIIAAYEDRIGEPLKHIYLAGGVTRGVGVPQFLSDLLEREVAIGNPFDRVAYPAFMEDIITDIGPIFAPSLGAALQHFS